MEPQRINNTRITGNGGKYDQVESKKASRAGHAERHGRTKLSRQATDNVYESHLASSVDLDASGDLGLQSRLRTSDDDYPINGGHDTIPSKGPIGGPSKASSEGSIYSVNQLEKTPSQYSFQVSDIPSSASPSSQEDLDRQQVPQPNPRPSKLSKEIPMQESDITLYGSVSSNGVYKIRESNFERDCTFIRRIGEGGFGRIELHKHGKTGKLLVLKKTRESFEYTNGIPKEAHILRNIINNGHKRLPCLYHFNTSLAECHYWMDYCDCGDLLDMALYFLYRGLVVPEGFIWHVHTQLSAATAYLHTGLLDYMDPERPPPPNWQPIVHRDIKPDNVFLKFVPGNRYPDIVLGDFGLATTNLVTGGPYHFLGTACWQSPQFPYHTIDSDVWSAGAVIHYLALIYPPLAVQPKDDPRTSKEWECDGRTRKVWDISWRGYSVMLQETLKEWLSLKGAMRPVGLSGVLKAEGGRTIWLAEGGVERNLGEWPNHAKSGKPDPMDFSLQRKKKGAAKGFEEDG